jgi:hypothetical protein
VPCRCTVIDDIRYLHLLCDALINDIFCLFCAEESAVDSHSTRSCPPRLTMPLFNLRDISDESLSIASSYVVRFSCLVLKDFIDIDPPGLPHTRFFITHAVSDPRVLMELHPNYRPDKRALVINESIIT